MALASHNNESQTTLCRHHQGNKRAHGHFIQQSNPTIRFPRHVRRSHSKTHSQETLYLPLPAESKKSVMAFSLLAHLLTMMGRRSQMVDGG